jgi:integrase/recombinase XerD
MNVLRYSVTLRTFRPGHSSKDQRLVESRTHRYAAHHDLTEIGVIEQALSVPMKRFEKLMLEFLTREEMRAILGAPDATTWAGRRDRALFNVMYNTGPPGVGSDRSAPS